MANIPICIDGCLTVNDQGSLVVNVSGATECDTGSLEETNCIDGVLYGAPEKSTRFLFAATPNITSPIQTLEPNADGEFHEVGTATTIGFINPSTCLDMTLVIKVGPYHGLFQKPAAGNLNFQPDSSLKITIGATPEQEFRGGHQHWRGDDGAQIWDAYYSPKVFTFTLPAGQSMSATIQSLLAVITNTTGTGATATNWTTFIEILAFHP